MFRGLAIAAVMAVLAVGSFFPQQGARAGDDAYAFLILDGQKVKWGAPRLGTPAHVRFAFLRTAVERPGSINCRSMRPFPPRLGPNGLTNATIAAEFRGAFATWQSLAGIRFEEVADAADADIILGVQAVPAGIAYADIVPRKRPGADMSEIRKAAVCFNPDFGWKSRFDGNLTIYDVRYVALHEIGHAIGLDHVWGEPGRIMAIKYQERFRQPQPGDVAGARALYGGPTTEPAPAPKPVPKLGLRTASTVAGPATR
ncbi:MAG: matrixin family metalloprotease [Alphaproteobacteria bacterium]|nr:matrixin family metalloprotease [Alphaproteobacteria bacterium]